LFFAHFSHLPFTPIFGIFEIGMDNIALEKSRKFAIRVYNLYKYLCDEKHEFTLAKQLLRSGTSIGANLTEAQYSVSKKEFLVKAQISLKETAETEYWLDLLKEINLITQNEHTSIIKDCKEILRILNATTKTVKTNNNK
jgi:four helix bundle protein